MSPRVSVIMPVYKGAKFLDESIGSLFGQSFADFEIIAVDDGSTDDSLEVLNRLARQDTRLQVRSRPNSGGPAAPKNDGMQAALGEYIGFFLITTTIAIRTICSSLLKAWIRTQIGSQPFMILRWLTLTANRFRRLISVQGFSLIHRNTWWKSVADGLSYLRTIGRTCGDTMSAFTLNPC